MGDLPVPEDVGSLRAVRLARAAVGCAVVTGSESGAARYTTVLAEVVASVAFLLDEITLENGDAGVRQRASEHLGKLSAAADALETWNEQREWRAGIRPTEERG